MRVLLGVCGGIAAYKAAAIVRRLQDGDHEVRCAFSAAASRFASELTLEVLSGHAVYSENYLEARGTAEEEHITAAAWADVLCVAPATANMIARLAHGLAEDFLSTTALAFDGPVLIAPAMHSAMWAKAAVQQNIECLEQRGVEVIGPEKGRLASGEHGWGRMTEPEEIVAAIIASTHDERLSGRLVVVSAGPTHERLDPVRFLSNRSSGKMGFSLAAEAARRGARVTLIAGPVSLTTPPGVHRVDVVSAREMQKEVNAAAERADLIVMAAAVSDFRPTESAEQKIKKGAATVATLALTENPDILAGLAEVAPQAVRVGFAAETENLERNAAAKLERKQVHFLVANDVSRAEIGFGSDDNEVTVYPRDAPPIALTLKSKRGIATELIDIFARAFEA